MLARHRLSTAHRLLPLFPIVLFGVAACGSETNAIPPPSDRGTKSDSDPTAAIPSGTCRFVIVDGERRISWVGKPRARMNGSGNLLVRCDATGDAGAGSEVELAFGNGTFDGPRTYLADDFAADGRFSYAPEPVRTYTSNVKGGSCSLILEQAPLDADGDSVPKGGLVVARFTCKAIMATSTREGFPSSFAVESGELSVVVE